MVLSPRFAEAHAANPPEGPADLWAAWRVVSVYYGRLREWGARVRPDGKVDWPDGIIPPHPPKCPPWLPCHPWAVEDEADWQEKVGAGMALL